MATNKQILVTTADLHSDDFIIEGGKVRTVHIAQEYQVTLSRHFTVQTTNDADDRRKLRILNGFGLIRLDIKRSSANTSSGWVGTLPGNCPAPRHLLEVMAPDGATFYVGKGDRNIMSTNAKANTRYLINIPGFFA